MFNYNSVIFQLFVWNSSLSIHCQIALMWMPQYHNNENLTLVQVMAWCHRTTSQYLSNVCPDLYHHMASLGHSKLKYSPVWYGCRKNSNNIVEGIFFPWDQQEVSIFRINAINWLAECPHLQLNNTCYKVASPQATQSIFTAHWAREHPWIKCTRGRIQYLMGHIIEISRKISNLTD